MINKEDRFRLFKARVASVARFLIFAAVIVVVFILLPPNAAAKAKKKWTDFVEYVKTYHSPFYDFVTHKDMDRAAKEYEDFKPRKNSR